MVSDLFAEEFIHDPFPTSRQSREEFPDYLKEKRRVLTLRSRGADWESSSSASSVDFDRRRLHLFPRGHDPLGGAQPSCGRTRAASQSSAPRSAEVISIALIETLESR
jgi:hypothetical protein